MKHEVTKTMTRAELGEHVGQNIESNKTILSLTLLEFLTAFKLTEHFGKDCKLAISIIGPNIFVTVEGNEQ